MPISSSLLAAAQLFGGQSSCFKYAFDKNGNRLSKSNLTWGSGTWGSTTYGCFNWTS